MILTRDYFRKFDYRDSFNILRESYERSRNFSATSIRSGAGTTVFISHKHDDLDEIKGLVTCLEDHYNVIPYIDSMDKRMPHVTCRETAERIKTVINYSEKFILLATNNALSSKWCNWEVGIADKSKYQNKNMAILPLRDDAKAIYNGNEYLELYPYIEEEINLQGQKELFVNYKSGRVIKRITLSRWLHSSSNFE